MNNSNAKQEQGERLKPNNMNQKITQQDRDLIQLFNNSFDCYSECEIHDEKTEVNPAMTQRRFVEVVKALSPAISTDGEVREAIKFALNIKDLWKASDTTPEHEGEMQALRQMEEKLQSALLAPAITNREGEEVEAMWQAADRELKERKLWEDVAVAFSEHEDPRDVVNYCVTQFHITNKPPTT